MREESMDTVAVEVVEERIAGLQRWLAERFERVEVQLQISCCQHGRLEERFEELEERVREDHEKRLQRLERLAWLGLGVGGLLSPVAVWAVIQIVESLTGW